MMSEKEAAPSSRNAKKELSKRAFAETFGVSESQLERLFQQGMPHEKKGRKVAIPMPEGRVWYHRYLEEKGKKAARPRTTEDARLRKAAAEADLAEVELAERLDELMTVSDYKRAIGDAFSRARARLQNLAPRAAAAAFGAGSVAEGQAKIQPLVLEVMDELREASDVPIPDEDDSEADEEGAE